MYERWTAGPRGQPRPAARALQRDSSGIATASIAGRPTMKGEMQADNLEPVLT
jgi:hypothetical protein